MKQLILLLMLGIAFSFQPQDAAAQGTSGYALSFNGTNSYVSVADTASLNFGTATDFTVEAWIKFSASQTDYAGIACKGSPVQSASYGFQTFINGNRFGAEIISVGVADGLVGTTVLNNGQWHHVAFVVSRSAKTAKLFVDGTQEASVFSTVIDSNVNVSGSALLIGSERVFADYFNGTIDEVRISKVVRYTANFTRPSAPFTPDANTVVLYHFNENAGLVTRNAVNNGNVGTLTNSPTWVSGTAPLPVELTSFLANTTNGSVRLTWQTATEKNNAGFDIERSSDKITFAKIGFVKGGGTTTQAQVYHFTDGNVIGKVFYRLKQTDFDGKFEYSQAIEADAALPAAFTLNQNYPNPFNPTTVISYQLPASSLVTLKVYDVLGREVATLVNAPQAVGNYAVSFAAEKFSSGIYFYRLQADASTGAGKGFVQTRKMIIVK